MITILDISLLNCCCYSCPGCISGANLASYVNYEIGGITRGVYATNGMTLKPHILISFIRNHFVPSECIIQLSGGEPLLHDSFADICLALQAAGYRIAVNTNGNQIRSLSKTDDIAKWKIKWRCSWHSEFRNMQFFKEDIAPLCKNNVLVNYVAKPRKIESGEIKDDLADLEKCGYDYEITAFQGKWNGIDYNKLSPIYEDYITAFKGSRRILPVEVNYLCIIPNGDVMRCHRIKIGNIYENSIRERYPQEKMECRHSNGHTSCSLVQSFSLLGLL